jgi:UDP-N-acetylglucosamine--N-acetylmuramyl-(pentapeptide) pyrophosphoryl-undecaprenol N-acetylglucosamine transferase
MIKTNKKLIFLTAGGTGGHIYPAEALADELSNRSYKLSFITDTRGLKNYKGKLSKISNYNVLSGSIIGKSKIHKISSLIKVAFGVLQSIFILLKHRPCCVVGFGGYASFPCCVAAIILRIPLIIHEQNSVVSRTNRILGKHANVIAQSFRDVKNSPKGVKSVLTGMPVRQSILDIIDHKLPNLENNKFTILVIGGSQGAKIFSDIIPDTINNLSEKLQSKIKIFQQCRDADLEKTKEKYKNSKAEIVLNSFFNNMPELYSNSHIVITRAGASSTYELTAIGKASILVPLPIAADNHQYYNAKEICDAKAAYLLEQKNFTIDNLQEIIIKLSSDFSEIEKMSINAKKIGIIDASKRLADTILDEIK